MGVSLLQVLVSVPRLLLDYAVSSNHYLSYKCDLRQDLEIHFSDRNNGHRGFDHVCPSCLKRYKTPSALMAHLESATTRCSIRNSKGYGNVLHLVSGGHLNVDGRHNDGTTRIVSPEDAGKIPDIIW